MASLKHRNAPDDEELTSLPDFALLHALMGELGKMRSHLAQSLACEIMRRYTASSCGHSEEEKLILRTLGHARWGDAKRVEEIFDIKRGPLDRMRKAGLIDSCSLDDAATPKPQAARAKRMYDLVSIMRFLERSKDVRDHYQLNEHRRKNPTRITNMKS